MFTRVRFLIAVALVLIVNSTALAQGPVYPFDSDPAWQASYWNNTTLSGTPILERNEVDLDHTWGKGSPDASVNTDGFSARWTRYIYVEEGTYRFTTTSDDGIRVWVDNDLIIDEWYDHAAKTVKAEKNLTTGHHLVVVEFYENRGDAVAKLSWEPTTKPIQHWRGEYFNNKVLSGTPALVRDDAEVNFDWGSLSPDLQVIGVDDFSARWTRTLDLPAGHYRFKVTVDDGVRSWANGHLLIESWRDQAARTYTEDIYLPSGSIPIKMEYYENGGKAVAKLTWELLSPSIHNWRGEYFDNTTLSGTPALVRDDDQIDFNWGAGSPAPGFLTGDRFSVRWTRKLNLPAGRYRFAMTVDDGGRLWVNGHLLIDTWRDQAANTYAGVVDLPGGTVAIKMEYYEHTGLAVAQLTWDLDEGSSPGTVIVDDTDSGFITGGSSSGWRSAGEGYGDHLAWTWNNDWLRADYNWARWYPHLSAGRYEVLVFIPERYTTTSSARYTIVHTGGLTSRVVNQSNSGGRWVSLGTYWFSGSSSEYVGLTDVTGETLRTQLIAFDAVKWVPR